MRSIAERLAECGLTMHPEKSKIVYCQDSNRTECFSNAHKHAKVKAWLKRNPRFVPHFVPTSSSWMNLVERWFGHLDNKAIRRGVFRSVADLQASIEAFLAAWNEDPKPFVWTATVESIQEKLTRCRRTLEQIKPGCTSPKSRKKKK